MNSFVRVIQAILVALQYLFAGLAASSILLGLHPAIGVIAAGGILAVAAAQQGLNSYMNGTVVESVDNGVVVAGPANELPTGTVVREVGSLARRAVVEDTA